MRAGFASVSAGLIASVVAHLMLIVAVAIPHQRQTAHGETVSVELVPSDEAPAFNEPSPQDPAKPETEQKPAPKPEAQPDWSQLQNKPPVPESDKQQSQSSPQQQAPANRQRPANQQASQQQQGPQQQAQQQQQQQQQAPQQQAQQPPPQPEMPEPPANAQQPVENPAEQGQRLAALLGLAPPGETQDLKQSDVNADIKAGEMAAFKAHLKKCWTAPEGYLAAQRIKVVVRVMLRRDGKLAKDPEGVEITPASLAFPSYKSAISALKQCQPYTMLPAEKYNEWRVLDINMSPDQMAGG